MHINRKDNKKETTPYLHKNMQRSQPIGLLSTCKELLRICRFYGGKHRKVKYGLLSIFTVIGFIAAIQMGYYFYNNGMPSLVRVVYNAPIYTNPTRFRCIAKLGCKFNGIDVLSDQFFNLTSIEDSLIALAFYDLHTNTASWSSIYNLQAIALIASDSLMLPQLDLGYGCNITLLRRITSQMQDVWELKPGYFEMFPIECDDCVSYFIRFDPKSYLEASIDEIDWIEVIAFSLVGALLVIMLTKTIECLTKSRDELRESTMRVNTH
jgi:hypothetical protein